MQMSFLDCIGHLMTGSGLQELLEVVYTSNAVTHMMTGKAVSRAVRCHLLVDAAQNTILLAYIYNGPLPTKCETENHQNEMTIADLETDDEGTQGIPQDTITTDLTTASDLLDTAMSSLLSVEEVCSAELLERIQHKHDEKKDTMFSRTARNWVQYLNMVDILYKFIKE